MPLLTRLPAKGPEYFGTRHKGNFMKKVLKFIDEHVEEIFIAVMMGYFVIATILQVLFRFVLRIPASWTEETAKYTFIWMTFVGSSLGAKNFGHIRVDMLENALKGPSKLALNLFCQVMFLLFAVILTVVGINMLISLSTRPQISAALKIPMQWVYAALPVGMGLASMRIIRNLVKQISGLIRPKKEAQ
jgi:TRAP-type C4-dicarboxylate transport system permease small subunit